MAGLGHEHEQKQKDRTRKALQSKAYFMNPRVFGSASHRDDTEDSDLDLLIDPGEGLGLFGHRRIAFAGEELTKVRVDVRTPNDISESSRAEVLAEARPI